MPLNAEDGASCADFSAVFSFSSIYSILGSLMLIAHTYVILERKIHSSA